MPKEKKIEASGGDRFGRWKSCEREMCSYRLQDTEDQQSGNRADPVHFGRARFPRFNRPAVLKRGLPFLPREFAVCESLPDNLAYRRIEAVGIIQRIVSCGTI